MKLYRKFAIAVEGRLECIRHNDSDGRHKWEAEIFLLAKHCLPGGKEFSNGTQINLLESTPSNLIFNTTFYRFDKTGICVSSTDHTVTVTSDSLVHDYKLSVSGGPKMYEIYDRALQQEIPEWVIGKLS